MPTATTNDRPGPSSARTAGAASQPRKSATSTAARLTMSTVLRHACVRKDDSIEARPSARQARSFRFFHLLQFLLDGRLAFPLAPRVVREPEALPPGRERQVALAQGQV